tara:strand:+ start:1192 stop:1848 length:657 start_codon:yes stop_codon:yes gene_type:complete
MTDIGYMYAQTKNSSNYLVLDSDNVEISNNLIVLNDASFNGDVDISGDLIVQGDVSCNNLNFAFKYCRVHCSSQLISANMTEQLVIFNTSNTFNNHDHNPYNMFNASYDTWTPCEEGMWIIHVQLAFNDQNHTVYGAELYVYLNNNNLGGNRINFKEWPGNSSDEDLWYITININQFIYLKPTDSIQIKAKIDGTGALYVGDFGGSTSYFHAYKVGNK